ncbi:MAG: group II truncated hemoglobin [Zoogloea sp.]|nr:group II truncated hemoglobin [Zoogloea sp.]
MPDALEEQTPYELLGGEAGLKELTQRFYTLMDTLPEAWGIRKMHPEDLAGSRQKLFMYLSGWLGGPDLFVEAYGHPMLRARHLPFAIGSAERDEWLLCMRLALDECVSDEALRHSLFKAMAGLADHMRNQREPQQML